tara:strand:- start:1900 stop:2172 length:273 start_codon:yes stop_codon:yes gene_type:complete
MKTLPFLGMLLIIVQVTYAFLNKFVAGRSFLFALFRPFIFDKYEENPKSLGGQAIEFSYLTAMYIIIAYYVFHSVRLAKPDKHFSLVNNR